MDQQQINSLIDAFITEEVINELVKNGRESLLDYTRLTFPKYRTDMFHAHLAAQLDRVVSGEIRDLGYRGLIISAPPQHGKSELVSVRLPAYWLSKRPDDPIILTSYSAKLAIQKSKKARAVIGSPIAQYLFPDIGFNRDSRAADYWEVADYSGYVLAGGVNGPLTGFGAVLAVVDDPFKSWAEAQSKTIRDSVWEWWEGTFLTRLSEDGTIILMATRWNEDDLTGRILDRESHRWLVLKYPALSIDPKTDILGREMDVPLAPSRYSQQYLTSIRDNVSKMVWLAEYQQEPTTPEGIFFRTDCVRFLSDEDLPNDLTYRIRYWDLAGTSLDGSNDPDYAVGSLVAIRQTPERPQFPDFYHLEMERLRGSPGEIENAVLRTAHRDGPSVPIWIEQEPGSAGKTVIHFYKKALPGFRINGDRPTGEKLTRATTLASAIESGRYYLISKSWNDPFIQEMSVAPNGKHDDTWDSAAGAVNKLILQTKKKARNLG